jgi:hypothetical protein
MRKFLPVLIIAVLALVAVPAKANDTSTCGSTLSALLVTNYTCTIGPLTFSNFTFSSTASGTYTMVTAGSVAVISLTTPGNDGLEFNLLDTVNSITGGAGGIDVLLGFTVTDTTKSIDDLGLNITGSAVGTGFVQMSENYCTNGPVSACTQGNTPLTVTDPPPVFTATTTFAPTTSVSVEKDLTVDVGAASGNADVSEFAQTFSTIATPESASLTLLGLGLLGLAGIKRSKLGQLSL